MGSGGRLLLTTLTIIIMTTTTVAPTPPTTSTITTYYSHYCYPLPCQNFCFSGVPNGPHQVQVLKKDYKHSVSLFETWWGLFGPPEKQEICHTTYYLLPLPTTSTKFFEAARVDFVGVGPHLCIFLREKVPHETMGSGGRYDDYNYNNYYFFDCYHYYFYYFTETPITPTPTTSTITTHYLATAHYLLPPLRLFTHYSLLRIWGGYRRRIHEVRMRTALCNVRRICK